VEKKFTKKDGKPFAVVTIEDFTGQLEMVAWDDVYTQHAELLKPGTVVGVSARLTLREEAVRAMVNSFTPLKPKASVKPVRLRLARNKLTETDLPQILEVVKRHPGKSPLHLEFVGEDGRSCEILASEKLTVGDEASLLNEIARFAAA